MANRFIEYLRGNGAGADNPAPVQHVSDADRLAQHQDQYAIAYQNPRHQAEHKQNQERREQEKTQAAVDAHFDEIYQYVTRDDVSTDGWGNANLPNGYKKWDNERIAGYAYNLVRLIHQDRGDDTVLSTARTHEVFEILVNRLPYSEERNKLVMAFNDPTARLGEVNVDKLKDIDKEYEKRQKGEGLFRNGKKWWNTSNKSNELEEYKPNVVDCTINDVKGLDRDGRAALRAANDGDYNKATRLLASPRCSGRAVELVNRIINGGSVTPQTITSLNRMRNTDGADEITLNNLKSNDRDEDPSSDIQTRPSNGKSGISRWL